MLSYYLLLLGVPLLLSSPAVAKLFLTDLTEKPKTLLSAVLSGAPRGKLSHDGGL